MRASGILMHITSLPGPNGIGSLGKPSFRFVDFLAQAKQSYWQVLPLNPTGFGDSPYQGFSAFAGNPYVIDLEALVEQGLLTRQEVDSTVWSYAPNRVDYGTLSRQRSSVLRHACRRFMEQPTADFEDFIQREGSWLEDYALFMALKTHFPGTGWQNWEAPVRLREEGALQEYRQKLAQEIRFQYFLQYVFDRQWRSLRQYAKEKGISIIGDVPIYVPLDSADVWANPELFQLDEERCPKLVAGVPPDAFSEDGQLWGNPLYDWEKMEQDGYGWWMKRLAKAAEMYDVVRLDHFRGFESYWAVPAGEPTAKNGSWVKGPDHAFIRAIEKNLPDLAFIAEDLGVLTQEVRQLCKDSGYPGMKVLQFAFAPGVDSEYLPHHHVPNSVCYMGTHDNQTTCQWFREADPQTLEFAKRYMGLTREEGYVWGMIRTGMASVSKLFVVQMQDYLELDADARMNFPGTMTDKNWTWRAEDGMINEDLAQRIGKLTELFGRAPADKLP